MGFQYFVSNQQNHLMVEDEGGGRGRGRREEEVYVYMVLKENVFGEARGTTRAKGGEEEGDNEEESEKGRGEETEQLLLRSFFLCM
jgi:hypothetical protein